MMRKINIKNTWLNFLVLAVFCIQSQMSLAISLIKDQEIEDGIYKLSTPLARNAKIQNLKLFILNDKAINAFTVGGEEIYINTGLLEALAPDEVAAVIAHEMGHVAGGHVFHRAEYVASSIMPAMISVMAIGVLGALADSTAALSTFATISGRNFVENSYFKNSRSFESNADQFACNLLIKSNYDLNGLSTLFEHFKKNSPTEGFDKYKLTHPLHESRFDHAKICYNNFLKQRPKGEALVNLNFFKRVSIKLKAFMSQKPENILQTYKNDKSTNAIYAQSIAYFKLYRFKEALALSDELIKREVHNPYFYEWRGQILFNLNKTEASLQNYATALKYLPQGGIIRLEKIMLQLETMQYSKADNLVGEIYNILDHDKDNVLAWKLLAKYYDRVGDDANKYYSLGQANLYSGKYRDAKRFVHNGLKLAPMGSVTWYKLQDLLVQINDYITP